MTHVTRWVLPPVDYFHIWSNTVSVEYETFQFVIILGKLKVTWNTVTKNLERLTSVCLAEQIYSLKMLEN